MKFIFKKKREKNKERGMAINTFSLHDDDKCNEFPCGLYHVTTDSIIYFSANQRKRESVCICKYNGRMTLY